MKSGKLFNKLMNDFLSKKIPIDEPGFYDHPKFLEEERKNPRYIMNYALYVLLKQYEKNYYESVESKIKCICNILFDELIADGRTGACIDLSMVLSRILDKIGIWNYMVKGALTIKYPCESSIPYNYYWPIDINDTQAGHVWVCAPPFKIIDLTIGLQPYDKEVQKFIPNTIFSKQSTDLILTLDDFCSPEFKQIMHINKLPLTIDALFSINPDLRQITSLFNGTIYNYQETVFKYIPCAISASDMPLENITSLILNGQTGFEIFNNKIKPLFS